VTLSSEDSTRVTTRELSLLLFEVDAFVVVARDAYADLGGSLAGLGEPVRVESFFGACGALGAMQALITASQTCMAQRAITTAVTGELVERIADVGGLLVDMHLPRVAEIVACKLRPGENRRKSADLQWRSGMVGGDFVGGVGPLRVTCGGESENRKRQDPAVFHDVLHGL